MFCCRKKRAATVQIEDLEQSVILRRRTPSRRRVIESDDDSEFSKDEDRTSQLSSQDPETSMEISALRKGRKAAAAPPATKPPSKKELKAQEKAAELEQRDKMDKEPLFNTLCATQLE